MYDPEYEVVFDVMTEVDSFMEHKDLHSAIISLKKIEHIPYPIILYKLANCYYMLKMYR